MEPIDLTYFKEKVKLYFSSLFARHMNYAIFGIPGLSDIELLFTSVELDQVTTCRSDMGACFHLVTLKDERFCKLLFELFPLLKTHLVLLDVKAFMLGINKHLKVLDKCQLALVKSEIVFSCEDYRNSCGYLISEFTANYYYQAYLAGIPDNDEPYQAELNFADISTTSVTKLKVYDRTLASCYEVRPSCYLTVYGKNTVAFSEYLPKASETDDYQLTLVSAAEVNQPIKVMLVLTTPSVTVKSVQPAVVCYSVTKPVNT